MIRRGGLWLLALAACRDPTEIRVTLTTTVPCDRVRGTDVFVSAAFDDATAPGASTTACTGSGDIGSIVLVPSGSTSAKALVRVTTGVGKDPSACAESAADAAGCIFTRRRVAFIPHASLAIGIEMQSACIGVVCEPELTCNAGACVPIDTPLTDAGPPEDATPGDAAPDAAADAGDAGPCPASPTLLYGTPIPSRIVANATYVAFLLPSSVVLVSRGAGPNGARPASAPLGLAIDGSRVYYSDATGLRAVDLTDVGRDTLVFPPQTAADHVGAVAADASGVVFVHDLPNGVELRDLSGVLASTTGGPSPGEQLALSPLSVFMTRGNVVYLVPRASVAIDLNTRILGTESTAPTFPCALGERPYWIEAPTVGDSKIYTSTIFGATVSLPITLGNVLDLTCAPAKLLWTSAPPAALFRLDDGASVPVQRDSVTTVGPVASDGTCVFYWASSPKGTGIFWASP